MYLAFMSKLILTIAAIAIFYGINAQPNLVPNNSFEVIDSCPSTVSQLRFAQPWFSPSLGTPDVYNACSGLLGVPDNLLGYENARTGIGYAGIGIHGNIGTNREYIAVKLNEPLKKYMYYCFTIYCSLRIYFMKPI